MICGLSVLEIVSTGPEPGKPKSAGMVAHDEWEGVLRGGYERHGEGL